MSNDIIYVIPRPETGKYVSIDIKSHFELIISKCYRTMIDNNICICVNKKTTDLYVDGYFKKGDDIYISLIIDNMVNHNNDQISIKPLLNGKPKENISIFDKNKLELIKINGNWISNIYDKKTEFIYNFTLTDDIIPFKITIEFDLPYVDGIHSDTIIANIDNIYTDVIYTISIYSNE